jgi:hypothetical protein
MLRGLGRFIWSQTRDMQVYNYPRAILYEIRTSDGNVWLKFCKSTEAWTVGKQRPGDVHDILKEPPLPLEKHHDIKSSLC